MLAGCGSADGSGAADGGVGLVELASIDGDGFAAVIVGADPTELTCPTLDAARGLVVELRADDGSVTTVALDALDPGALPTGARVERTPEVLLEVGPLGLFVASTPQLSPPAECHDGALSTIEQALVDEAPRPAAVGVTLDGVVTEIELPVDPTTWELLPDGHVAAAAAWAEGRLMDVATPGDG